MTIEVRLPKFPECWETCGDCGQGEVLIDRVHVQPGDTIRCDDPLITLETGKVALDIPSPQAGTIVAVHVAEGDTVAEGALIATLAPS
jgi:pyruvate/2-oxoglutarate dehydrogenase complex dihydrolipoamide acyltransferase (E2) component